MINDEKIGIQSQILTVNEVGREMNIWGHCGTEAKCVH